MNHPLPKDPCDKATPPGQRLPESVRKTLSLEAEREILALASKYPQPMAATIPALYVAQREFGFLSLGAMREVARVLNLPEGHVFGVATFYTLFKKHPVGKFHFQVCTSLSCALNGAARVMARLSEMTGAIPGEGPTQDGMWSIEEVECLASCGSGPCMQVNREVYDEFIDEAALERILEACRTSGIPEWGAE